jgi:hypothetical protein
MKSQEKIKRQRRIKAIPDFCDNPISTKIRISIAAINAVNRKVSKHSNTKFACKKTAARRALRRMNRNSN